MANHYHAIGWTEGEPLDRVMAWLLKRVSDEINQRARRINHVFGGPYRWTLIEHSFHYAHALRYVVQNPLRAGCSKSVEAYRFSTMYGLTHGLAELPVTSHPFESGAYRFATRQGFSDWSPWLNEAYDDEHRAGLRRALHRRRFAFYPDRRTRRLPEQFRDEELTK
jgi:hypothetical protein